MLSTGCGLHSNFRIRPQSHGSRRQRVLRAGSGHVCAAASPVRAAGLAAREGHGEGAKKSNGQAASGPANLTTQGHKDGAAGRGASAMGTFAGGRGKGKQYDFVLIVQSPGRKNRSLVSKGLGLQHRGGFP